MIDRTTGVALGAGLVVISIVTLLSPMHAPPLYDGVAITEPYRYLSPQPGQAGDPTSATVTLGLVNGASSPFAAATSEIPPQAQLIAPAGAFVGPGATTMTITITPVTPAAAGPIVGNAYRLAAVDQAGAPVPVASGSQPTLVLRAPPEAAEVAVVHLVEGQWTGAQTQVSGQADSFMTGIDQLGDFALEGSVPSTGGGLDPRYLLAGALTAFGVVLLLLVLWPRHPRPIETDTASPRARVPRKRRRGQRR